MDSSDKSLKPQVPTQILTIKESLKLRTVRGTFKHFKPGDKVLYKSRDRTDATRFLGQPLNSKGKPSTSFPYWIKVSQVVEEVKWG